MIFFPEIGAQHFETSSKTGNNVGKFHWPEHNWSLCLLPQPELICWQNTNDGELVCDLEHFCVKKKLDFYLVKKQKQNNKNRKQKDGKQ